MRYINLRLTYLLTSVIAANDEDFEEHFDYWFRYCRHVIEIFSMCATK